MEEMFIHDRAAKEVKSSYDSVKRDRIGRVCRCWQDSTSTKEIREFKGFRFIYSGSSFCSVQGPWTLRPSRDAYQRALTYSLYSGGKVEQSVEPKKI